MPEGPEISFMTYFFNDKYKNTILNDVKILSGRYTRHPLPKLFDQLLSKLPSKIIEIKNKGKFIYIILENNYFLGLKLNYGHLVNVKESQSHIEFITNKESFYIDDLRNFATISVLTEEELNDHLNKIGPDLVHELITFDQYNNVMNKHPRLKIGSFLIEQKYFSGGGNYIRAETLYESKINPFRLVKDLTTEERKIIFKNLIKICHEAYESLIKNGLHYKLKVYRQKITPNGEKVISEKFENNRNIYWVPTVQK